MKFSKIIGIFLLLISAVGGYAQFPVNSGFGSVSVIASEPSLIYSTVSLNSTNNFVSSYSESVPSPVPTFFAYSKMSGFTYALEPTSNARGNVSIGTLSCQNARIGNPASPQTSRYVISFADFFLPKFNIGQTRIELVVPFTMTGRISCFSGDQLQPIVTAAFSGSGTAELQFKRVTARSKTLSLNSISLTFAANRPRNKASLK